MSKELSQYHSELLRKQQKIYWFLQFTLEAIFLSATLVSPPSQQSLICLDYFPTLI